MQIEISDEIAVRIDKIIDRILSDPDSGPYVYKFEPPIDIRPIISAERILPMMFDWSGFYSINRNGEIVFVDLGPPFDIRPEADERICRMVLCQGVKRYAELIELLPIRPDEAVDCSSCDGTGREPTNDLIGFDQETIVCWCGGLGWLPKGEYQPGRTAS